MKRFFINFIGNSWKTLLLSGILTFLFGMVSLIWPDLIISIFIYIVSFFALIMGVIQIKKALDIKDNLKKFEEDNINF